MILLSLVIGCGAASPAVPGAVAHRPVAHAAARSSVGPTGPPVSIVNCNGGGDFRKIQAAIDAAPREGWIQVEPCAYNEALDLGGKSLWIQSSGGSAVTTLDAGFGTGIRATTAETDGAALVGFTVSGTGGGALVDHSALRLQDIVFTDVGGEFVIDVEGGDLELEGVVFSATNDAFNSIVELHRGSITAHATTVDCGAADFGMHLEHGTGFLDGVTVECRGVGETALYSEHTVGRIQRSTLHGPVTYENELEHPTDRFVVENTVQAGAVTVLSGTAFFRNSVFVNSKLTFTGATDPVLTSDVFVGGGCVITSDTPVLVDHSDFFDVDAMCDGTAVVGVNGNLAVDPLFTNPAAGDYTPAAGSPLIDAGNPDPAYADPDGSPNDIGLTGGRFSILGGW